MNEAATPLPPKTKCKENSIHGEPSCSLSQPLQNGKMGTLEVTFSVCLIGQELG